MVEEGKMDEFAAKQAEEAGIGRKIGGRKILSEKNRTKFADIFHLDGNGLKCIVLGRANFLHKTILFTKFTVCYKV